VRLTRSAVALAVVGVLLLVAAAVLRFVVVPSVSKLPDDLDITQEFEGTYSGLNAAALSGGPGEVLVRDVPVTASRQIAVESVEGDTAIVARTVERSIGGQPDPSSVVRYAVDRTDLESVPAPDGAEDVVASEGLVFSLPIDPSTETDYRLWDQTTATAYPLAFEGEDTLEGRSVYLYRSEAEGPVADPESLGLPTSLPKPQLLSLAPALGDLLPSQLLAQLPALLPLLPDEIPLSYTSATTSVISADAELGATIAGESTQEITASLPLGPQSVDVPFSTIELASTEASISERAADTADSAGQLNLVGTVLPAVALGLGVLLLLAALVVAWRAGRRPGGGAPPAVVPAQRPTQPV
jgi:hypothetical protein